MNSDDQSTDTVLLPLTDLCLNDVPVLDFAIDEDEVPAPTPQKPDIKEIGKQMPPLAFKAAYDPNIGKQMKKISKEINEQCEPIIKAVLLQHQLDATLNVQHSVKVTPKGKPGSAAAYTSLINIILTREGAKMTQKAIREKAQEKHPSASITKNWNHPIPSWASRKIRDRLSQLEAPFNSIKLPPKTTLNILHKEARKAIEKHTKGKISYTAKIEVNDSIIVINGQPFPVSSNRSSNKDYKQLRISTDKFIAALEKA